MVAVMVMEPDGLGHNLLTEWGLYMRDPGEGRHSWAVKPRLDPGYHGDPPDRVRLVDKIIARHKLSHHSDWSVISRFYLSDLAMWQIARGLRWSESRVNTVILTVCGMVEREYLDIMADG